MSNTVEIKKIIQIYYSFVIPLLFTLYIYIYIYIYIYNISCFKYNVQF